MVSGGISQLLPVDIFVIDGPILPWSPQAPVRFSACWRCRCLLRIAAGAALVGDLPRWRLRRQGRPRFAPLRKGADVPLTHSGGSSMPARYWHRLLLAVLVVILPAAVLPAHAAGWPAARQCGRRQAQAAAGSGAADAGRPAAARQAQSTGRLPYRSLCLGPCQGARAAHRQARHRVRRQHGRQGVRHRRPRRPAGGQGDRRRASIGRAGSPTTTARSTSPSPRKSPRSTMSRTCSTIRPSRS